ncbi:hypothetical protein DPMN_179717 [Dreissena polymorpha]|uniref:Uncharacterized protein n=1 Tax=Dreissena polymorpha TaxID=45954 RepID=A0A9D4EHQ6_DREPO|nr:hypothetical protein DPMN_179717 [Dreissena polymorpha]
MSVNVPSPLLRSSRLEPSWRHTVVPTAGQLVQAMNRSLRAPTPNRGATSILRATTTHNGGFSTS